MYIESQSWFAQSSFSPQEPLDLPFSPDKKEGGEISLETRFAPEEREYLRLRAIPLAAAQLACWRSVTAQEAHALFPYIKPTSGGLLMNYLSAGSKILYRKVRLRHPGAGPKCLSPKGEGTHPFLPPAPLVPLDFWKDPSQTLYLAEGAPKALALTAAGFPCIGLNGVQTGHDAAAWQTERRLSLHLDLLARIRFSGRKVVIVFDAGRALNPLVAKAEAFLSACIKEAGGLPFSAALPLHEGKDQGPDDFLFRQGRDALAQLFAEAKPASPFERMSLLLQEEGEERFPQVAALLKELPFRAQLHQADELELEQLRPLYRPLHLSKGTMLSCAKEFEKALRAKQRAKLVLEASQGEEKRPVVVVSQVDNQQEANEGALLKLARHTAQKLSEGQYDKAVFQRGGELVRVLCARDLTKLPKRLFLDAQTPLLARLPQALLQERLSAAVSFVSERGVGERAQLVPTSPPLWMVQALAAYGQWEHLPELRGVVETPVLKPDGTIQTRKGYDEETGLFLTNAEGYDIPQEPTLSAVESAKKDLLYVVKDFPFAGEAHRSVWVASVLTPLCRFAYEGNSPMFFFDANIRRAGKSKLARLAALLSTGRSAATATWSRSEEEQRKVLSAALFAGSRTILLDNITGTFGSGVLDALLTSFPLWQDRLLGKTENRTAENLATLYATGNNATFRGDTPQRTLGCRLESPYEKPEEREDLSERDIEAYVRRNQKRLTSAALTLLRAYCAAGKPDMGLVRFGGFQAWSDLVRNCLVWCGFADPYETRADFEARGSDTELETLSRLYAGWEELAGEAPLTVKEALDELSRHPASYATLRSAFLDLCPGEKLPDANALGRKLAHFCGRPLDGKRLVVAGKDYRLGKRWNLERLPGSKRPTRPKKKAPTYQEFFAQRAHPSPLPALVSGEAPEFGSLAGGPRGELSEEGREDTFPPESPPVLPEEAPIPSEPMAHMTEGGKFAVEEKAERKEDKKVGSENDTKTNPEAKAPQASCARDNLRLHPEIQEELLQLREEEREEFWAILLSLSQVGQDGFVAQGDALLLLKKRGWEEGRLPGREEERMP